MSTRHAVSDFWTANIPNDPFKVIDDLPFKEAGLLKLNCDKALFHLKWDATLDYNKTVKMTADWYSAFYEGNSNMFDVTLDQVDEYEVIGVKRGSPWTK